MPDWDLHLLDLINRQWTHPLLDWLMPALSAINAWLPLIALVVLWAAWRGGKKARLMIVCLAVSLILGDAVLSNVLKKSIGRVRPRDALVGVVVRDLGPGSPNFLRLFKAPVSYPSRPRGDTRGKSFPSSHVVNMFSAAMVVASFYRGWGVFMFALAASIAWARIYVGAHWPSDIPPSVGMGLLVGLTAVLLVSRIAHRPRRVP